MYNVYTNKIISLFTFICICHINCEIDYDRNDCKISCDGRICIESGQIEKLLQVLINTDNYL